MTSVELKEKLEKHTLNSNPRKIHTNADTSAKVNNLKNNNPISNPNQKSHNRALNANLKKKPNEKDERRKVKRFGNQDKRWNE